MSEKTPEQKPTNARDPLPRVFIVCGVITAVLMVIILGAIFLDLARRSQQDPIQPMVPSQETPSIVGDELEDSP